MISWRTDIENAPRDGTAFLVPNPFPPINGVESGVYVNRFFENSGKPRFSVPFTRWTEINLPEDSVVRFVKGVGFVDSRGDGTRWTVDGPRSVIFPKLENLP